MHLSFNCVSVRAYDLNRLFFAEEGGRNNWSPARFGMWTCILEEG